MSDASNNATPSSKFPHMTALSTAFPMSFESTPPPSSTTPGQAQPAQAKPDRSPHRHDAGH